MATNIGVLKATLGLDVAGFSAGAGKAKAEIAGLDAAAAKTSGNLRAAAGANANLVSQFNDIGVMLAAGQNPLQLALQQGTQISQVLTQMGGGVGALRALGSAFVGMLNPVSLLTIGVIGFGAAAVQWLMPAQQEAKKTEDAFKSLSDSMAGYNDALSLSLLYTGNAEEKYGAEAQKGAEIARRIMVMEANKTRKAVSSIVSNAYSDLGFDAYGDRGIDGAGRIETNNTMTAAENLGMKSNWLGGFDFDKLAEAEKLGNALRDIYDYVNQPIADGGLDDYLTGLREHLDEYSEQLLALKETGADETKLAAIDEKMIPLQQALLEGEARRAEIRAADAAKADEMLATMEGQLYMNELIAEYGKESVEVRQAELDAEYDKQVAAIESLNLTEEQKDALYDALSALHDNESQTLAWADAMAQVNAELQGAYSLIGAISGGMIMNAKISAARSVRDAGGTAVEARRAGEIAGRKQEILNGQSTYGSQYFGMSDAQLSGHLTQIDTDYAQQDEWSELVTEPRVTRSRKARAGGGGRSGGGRSGGGRRGRASPDEKFGDDVEKYQRETEALRDKAAALASVTAAGGDWERALALIEEEQNLLNDAQKAGIKITPEVTASIEAMAAAHVAAEGEFEKLRKTTEKGEDTFKGLFGSMVDGADAAKNAIANLAIEIAKVQFTKGAMSLLGSTSWGGSLIKAFGGLTSFDGGGDTGNGTRSGGLDGKGGFLAMMHPQETVIDRTIGQGVVGSKMSVHVTVSFDETGNLYVKNVARSEAESASRQALRVAKSQASSWVEDDQRRHA